MKPLPFIAVGSALVAPLLLAQTTDPVDITQLKTIVEGLGYTTKMINTEVGKEKFEFTIKTDSHNIPIGGEISPSKNYIWLTVFLGDSTKIASKHTDLLRENGKIQPSFFYITSSGNLMMACPIDNRGVNAAVLKRITDKISSDVSKTAPSWSPPPSH